MAFDDIYVTDKFTAYKGDVINVNLSLALWLIDDYTQNEPIGQVKVRIKEGDISAKKNFSGYYIFNDLPVDIYTVIVESDFYFAEERTFDISQLDPKNPLEEIVLKPKPSYPFPDNATLLRGLVTDNGPLINAVLRVVGMQMETITDENGEFVLYFKGGVDGNITFKIIIYGKTKQIDATIKEWETKSLGIIPFF